ncbi:hypothetical protein BD410DRAFT_730988 [Rickenella mellea]|uniref:BTB domain-containing protein n=1 Tax=Rickenella mellea TaxID=50990 RepID=A0A4Y7PNW7_9AGAM|nr:hypothetical protein BD410DRAFT_730988 [Rickenella mellea]
MDDSYILIQHRKQHPKLWFDDGNIVLTTNLSRFRVHRGSLWMNSPVFADMLSMPQPEPSNMEITFEGVPIVQTRMSDNCDDLAHLLNFFYNQRYYQGGTETTFEKISGLLRMSTKYQLDDLRDESLRTFPWLIHRRLRNIWKRSTRLLSYAYFRLSMARISLS